MTNLKRANGNGQEMSTNEQTKRGLTAAEAKRYLAIAGYEYGRHVVTMRAAPDFLGATWTLERMTHRSLLDEIACGSVITHITITDTEGIAGDVTFFAGQLQQAGQGTMPVPAGEAA